MRDEIFRFLRKAVASGRTLHFDADESHSRWSRHVKESADALEDWYKNSTSDIPASLKLAVGRLRDIEADVERLRGLFVILHPPLEELSEDGMRDFRKALTDRLEFADQEQTDEYANALCAFFLVELDRLLTDKRANDGRPHSSGRTLLASQQSSDIEIDNWKTRLNAERENYAQKKQAAHLFTQGEEEQKTSLMEAAERLLDAHELVNQAVSRAQGIETEWRGIERSAQNVFNGVSAARIDIVSLQAQLEAEKAFMREQVGLSETRHLWEHRSKQASLGYMVSLAALLIILIGLPIATIVFREEIFALVREVEALQPQPAQGTTFAATFITISRLLMISVPVGFVVWAIRLIVRFNTRSMLLMDDAQQRVTILNTYLFLIKREAATIQDRGALLEAMFRRAPGHGPETIEPQNLTDVMKYGESLGK
ncbi:hypothetical protein [Rhizobium terrae]|uniref:hypothetical protein n=1 Tax=Rhizobium terrae TaxID=2171756 RepID=UPI000E3D1BEF|nr:hypothetical protein [Rhizobium terrae]